MMGNKITLSRCIVGILSTLLLLATLVSSFQQQTVANNGWLYQSKRLYRRWLVQLFYKQIDPSIIATNRQYLRDALGFSEEKLDKIEDPSYVCNILTLDIGILDERANWLKIRLSSTDNEIKKMIQSQPTILSRTSESDTGIAPKIDYLQNRLLLDNISMKKLIQRLPCILGMSISENMEPKLDWLQQRLSLTDDELSKMIQRLPALFAYNKHTNMEPKLDWLQQRLSLTDEQLSEMIQRYPALLTLNVEGNLEPTLCFYIDALGKADALALVTGDPSAFGRSLEKRLKPRLERALDVGMIIDSKLLSLIIKYTDDQWNRKVTKRMGKTAYQ